MSRALRYRNPSICEHLASQYVAGSMTPRVRARMESLIAQNPELDRAVAQWSDSLMKIHDQFPSVQPSPSVWEAIDRNTLLSEQETQSKTATSFWSQLLVWRLGSAIGFATSFALAVILWLPSAPQPAGGANYIATMSASTMSANNVAADQANIPIEFVISAYKKEGDKPSRIHIQWSQQHQRSVASPLHVWAEDKETGQLTYIGEEPKDNAPWSLTKPTWSAITNSSRLLVTSNAQQPTTTNTLFTGPCIQLTDWSKG